MTPELAKHYIELGHIAHKGLPMAYMEFGPSHDRAIYEKVKCWGDTPHEAVCRLVRAIKLHPNMQRLHLYWRRDPEVEPVPQEEGGGFVASCRLLTSDSCHVSFDTMLDEGGELGPHLEPTLKAQQEGYSEIASITIRAYGQKEEIVMVGSGDHRRPEVADQAHQDGEIILSTLDRMRDKAKAADEATA